MSLFKAWPKIHRLDREVVITEKIDGANCCVTVDENGHVGTQCRTRTLSADDDVHGFHAWVMSHAQVLCGLGPGYHYGEWWGHRINRGYGLDHKRFSLFDFLRWGPNGKQADVLANVSYHLPELSTVPIVYQGRWLVGDWTPNGTLWAPQFACDHLRSVGSIAAPGFMSPEGIVVTHVPSRTLFKMTLNNDRKGEAFEQARAAADEMAEVASAPRLADQHPLRAVA